MDNLKHVFEPYLGAVGKLSQQLNEVAIKLAKTGELFKNTVPEETLKKLKDLGTPIEAPMTRDEAFKGVCRKDRRFK